MRNLLAQNEMFLGSRFMGNKLQKVAVLSEYDWKILLRYTTHLRLIHAAPKDDWPLQATKNGLTLRSYAEQIGKKESIVTKWRSAAEVAVGINSDWKDLIRLLLSRRKQASVAAFDPENGVSPDCVC